MFNIAIFQDDRRYLLQEIKVPVAYIGGNNDMGYTTVSSASFVHSVKLADIVNTVSEGLCLTQRWPAKAQGES